MGFIFGAVVWLRNLIIGDSAPLRVIQDSIEILGYVLFRLNFIVLLGGWLQVLFPIAGMEQFLVSHLYWEATSFKVKIQHFPTFLFHKKAQSSKIVSNSRLLLILI